MSTIVSNVSVYSSREFPFDQIRPSDHLEKRNRKFYVDYEIENFPIFLQTNRATILSPPVASDEEHGYMDIEITDPKRVSEMKLFLHELDDYNKGLCHRNNRIYFGRDTSYDAIESSYKPCYYTTDAGSLVVRFKIEFGQVRVFTTERQELSADDIRKGDTYDVIFEVAGLKIMKASFTAHLILRQMRRQIIQSKPRIQIQEYMFSDDVSRVVQPARHEDESIDSETEVGVLPKDQSSSSISKEHSYRSKRTLDQEDREEEIEVSSKEGGSSSSSTEESSSSSEEYRGSMSRINSVLDRITRFEQASRERSMVSQSEDASRVSGSHRQSVMSIDLTSKESGNEEPARRRGGGRKRKTANENLTAFRDI